MNQGRVGIQRVKILVGLGPLKPVRVSLLIKLQNPSPRAGRSSLELRHELGLTHLRAKFIQLVGIPFIFPRKLPLVR